MRNLIPLVGLGCVSIIILGVIAGGVIMIGYGLTDVFKKPSSQTQQPTSDSKQTRLEPLPKESRNLQQARAKFNTRLVLNGNYARNGEKIQDLADARAVIFPGPSGNLTAYISNDRKTGRKKPAVIWIHDGFGGITSKDWLKAKSFFQDTEFVLMVPSFREENVDNSGSFEMFLGEVDDLLAAVEYAAKQPNVDPNRIYVVGQGTGGTLALLAATTGTTTVRAFFAIGGTPDLEAYFKTPNAAPPGGVTPPFDLNVPNEAYLRSSLPFAGSIKQPTFYFGSNALDPIGLNQARRMDQVRQRGVSFQAFEVPSADPDQIATTLIKFIEGKISADSIVKSPSIRIEQAEVNLLFPKP